MINKFVIPESKLLGRIIAYKSKGVIPIIDYAVEHNKNKYTFEEKFKQILAQNPNNYHAIKLSAIDFTPTIATRLLENAQKHDCKILIDAEEVDFQDTVNCMTNEFIMRNNTHLFKTYQMYRKDALHTLENDMNLFQTLGSTLNVKLVRGAYLHHDRFTGKLHRNKEETDKMYNDAIRLLMDNRQKVGEIIFATHNLKSFNMIKDIYDKKCFHASLMGFDKRFLSKGSIRKMVYIPFGPYAETYPYLIRRLYENPFILNRFTYE